MSSRLIRRSSLTCGIFAVVLAAVPGALTLRQGRGVSDPSALVNPFIGTAGGGNTFPGAVLPFGMLSWSPETTRGDASRPAAPGGYHYEATRIRGFSLTHLSGTGCRGASGDIPFMPYTAAVTTSPALDAKNATYAADFRHADESATPGSYAVKLASGVTVELTATARSGVGRFTYPAGVPEVMLIRTSDTQIGSGDAAIRVDPATRTVTGSVTSGNFCGYIDPVSRKDYYTLHFVAVFDRPFASVGTWQDAEVTADAVSAAGGTTYGTDGFPPPGKGSGGWVRFGGANVPVTVRVGISYVSAENARANLAAEQPQGRTFDEVKRRARDEWNGMLGRIDVRGGSDRERRIFFTALYHSLLHMNLASDVNGDYRGFDGKVHKVRAPQRAQYANFSGWDVYRSQVQLVTVLDPSIASDMAQSLFNQATQNEGVWDRWTHNTGATHVMEGDPAAITVATIAAFGGTTFDVKGAYASLKRAATVPTRLDLSDEGCRVMCPGQRPSLDQWLSLKYIATESNSWGGAGATLESVSADFALAQLARRVGDADGSRTFLARSDFWRHVFNPAPVIAAPRGRGNAPAAADTEVPAAGGYIQNRNADGSWPSLTPSASTGFAEGSSVQYTWMLPFNPRGLFEAMGGHDAALARLDAFFHKPDGSWALRNAGGLHAQMSNEPSVLSPWLYLFAGRPERAQDTIRESMRTLWSDAPDGIPGNDDLGTMSAWYVFAAMGVYPYYPGRAELLVTAPMFDEVTIRRGNGVTLRLQTSGVPAATGYLTSVVVNGASQTRAFLPESFVSKDGRLTFQLSANPDPKWGRGAQDLPPSFFPE